MARETFPNPYSAADIVASDITDLNNPSVVFCGGAGNIKVTSAMNSGTVTFNNMASGSFLPLVVKRVWSGSTTCTNMIAMW